MNILVDTNTHKSLEASGATVRYVDSSHLRTLTEGTAESILEVRAEWLYHMYVDKGIDLVVIDDCKLGMLLTDLGVPTVRLI